MSGDTGSGGMPGTWWVEARDAAEYPTRHRTAATTKNYLAPNVNSATVEKLCASVADLGIDLWE